MYLVSENTNQKFIQKGIIIYLSGKEDYLK